MAQLRAAMAPRAALHLQLNVEKLKKMDLFSESDPYVVVSDAQSGAVLHTTEHVDNNANPRWREFSVRVLADVTQRPMLELAVFDKNTFTADKLIGEVRVGVDELLAGKARRLELTRDGNSGRGFLAVGSCEMVPC